MNLNSEHEKWMEQLNGFLSIPSISTNPKYSRSVREAALYTEKLLRSAGCLKTQIITGFGHPIVYGEYVFDSSKPTILIYGHYDVQPPGEERLWDSNPFSPLIKSTDIHPEGAIFARGTSDQKAQLFLNMKAFEKVRTTGQLNFNVKFLVEGEEEIGSIHFHNSVKANKNLLSSDVVLISDTTLVKKDVPTITTSLRGFTGLEVVLQTTENEMHSGRYGGAVVNPIFELCRLIGGLKKPNSSINLNGFYKDVQVFDTSTRNTINSNFFYIKKEDEPFLTGEMGYTSSERVGIRPSIDIHGIKGGYIQEGIKTIIPNKASAKISVRLVTNQSSSDIQNKLIAYFEENCSNHIALQTTKLPCAEPYLIPSNNPWLKMAKNAMKKVFGKEVVEFRSGGSLPIVSTFQSVLGCKSLLIGFGLSSDNAHGINEHFGITNLIKGMETISELLRKNEF